MKKFFEERLKVYEHELGAFLWMAAVFTGVFFFTAIFRNYVDTTFLKRYGVAQIPLMFVINGFLTIAVLGFMNRLAEKFQDYQLLTGFLAAYGILSAALYLLVKFNISYAYALLFQMLYLLDSVFLVYLWNIACDLFDARQGRRIFPLITASQVLGTAAGNFSSDWLGHAANKDLALVLFSLACLFIALALGRSARKRLPGAKSPAAKAGISRKKPAEIPAILKKYPIVRYLCILGLIPNLLLPIFAYQFNVIADGTFASEQSLITFLSLFRGIMTLATFFLLILMGRVYSRLSVVNASLVYPVNFFVVFGSLTFLFNIWTAALGQFSIRLVQQAVAGPAGKVLFNTVPREIALWSRIFVRGTVVKVGMIGGSLLMFCLKPVLSPRWLAPIAAGIALCWVVEVILFKRRYRAGLKQAIIGERIDFDRMDMAFIATDALHTETTPHAVKENPRPAPDEVPSLPVMRVETALKLLDDPDDLTRAEAAASLGKTRDPRAIRGLVRLLDDKEIVRRAASEALVNYGEALLPFLESVLAHGSLRVQQNLLEILRISNLKDFDIFPFLGQHAGTAYENILAIRVLSESNVPTAGTKMLEAHLQDQNYVILSLVFQALWVKHADMGLMFEALHSAEASVAVEMVEATVERDLARYLVPLIDNIPDDEKARSGRRVLPLTRAESPERVLVRLADSGDATTRMLTAYAIGEGFHDPVFIPTLEELMEDGEADVRQTAAYALKRCLSEEAVMPEIIELINLLRNFILFDEMGVRELRAIASVVVQEQFQTGEILMREGENNSSLYLLSSGEVRLYKDHGTAEEKLLGTLGPGAFMGELRLFTELPAPATCVVTETLTAHIIRKHHFLEIMRIYPQIGINISLFFALRLAVAEMKSDLS